MRFFTGIHIVENSVSFAFARAMPASNKKKLVCYTGTWTDLMKVSELACHTVSYRQIPSCYREAPRLIEMLSDIDEFGATSFSFIDGDIHRGEVTTAFLAGRCIPYEDGYSGDIELEEKVSYAEDTFPDFFAMLRKHRKEVPLTLYQAIYSSHLAEKLYPHHIKMEGRENPWINKLIPAKW